MYHQLRSIEGQALVQWLGLYPSFLSFFLFFFQTWFLINTMLHCAPTSLGWVIRLRDRNCLILIMFILIRVLEVQLLYFMAHLGPVALKTFMLHWLKLPNRSFLCFLFMLFRKYYTTSGPNYKKQVVVYLQICCLLLYKKGCIMYLYT